jgi:hypothetical protein
MKCMLKKILKCILKIHRPRGMKCKLKKIVKGIFKIQRPHKINTQAKENTKMYLQDTQGDRMRSRHILMRLRVCVSGYKFHVCVMNELYDLYAVQRF